MKNLFLSIPVSLVIASVFLFSAIERADAEQTGWKKQPDVFQYKGADWKNLVKRVNGISVEEAKKIAEEDPDITFFCITKGCQLVLQGKGVFHNGDVLFFSGKPWYGSAPGLGDSYEKVSNIEPDAPEKPDVITSGIILYGRLNCGLCQGMRSRLDNANIPYTFMDIDKSSKARSEMWEKVYKVRSGGGSVRLPVMDVNGTTLIGPSFSRVEELYNGR